MEILSEHTQWGFHIVFLIAAIVLATMFTVGSIAVIISAIKERTAEDFIGVVILTILALISITCVVAGIIQGPDVQYKAIVTDYNEVYDAGYTVVSTEGKIVTLTKE